MIFKKIRNFHWITKIIILLTGLLLGLLLIALIIEIVMTILNYDNKYIISNNIGGIIFSLSWILMQLFFVILVIIAIYMIATRVRLWFEKYLDAILQKMDKISDFKIEQENNKAILVSIYQKEELIEKKLEKIEIILEKVSE